MSMDARWCGSTTSIFTRTQVPARLFSKSAQIGDGGPVSSGARFAGSAGDRCQWTQGGAGQRRRSSRGRKYQRDCSQSRLRSEMEGLFLLERDLLDQQVIDVNGRKVVRVNDVDLHEDASTSEIVLKVG